jgi:hypothetical protein
MSSGPSKLARDEDLLGRLAMRFRRTTSPSERKKIAQDYAEVVERLIRSGNRQEAPPPEDQLPHDYMPAAFYRYWIQ